MRILKWSTVSSLFLFVVFFLANASSVHAVNSATLVLDPEYTVYTANAQVSIDLMVNPGNHSIDGVDAVIAYDSDVLTVKSIVTSDYFTTYPIASSDDEQIYISGLASINAPVSVSGTMATITFTVSATPPVSTVLSFVTGVDDGSHVAEHETSADVLFTTNTATLSTVQNPDNTPTPTITPTLAPGANTPTPTVMLPKSGLVSDTIGFGAVLFLLLLSGIGLLFKL